MKIANGIIPRLETKGRFEMIDEEGVTTELGDAEETNAEEMSAVGGEIAVDRAVMTDGVEVNAPAQIVRQVGGDGRNYQR